MKTILTALLFHLLLYIGVSNAEPKFCVNCKHFRQIPGCSVEFGRCGLFSKKKDIGTYLTTGIKYDINPEYFHCSTARTNKLMCGEEGHFFQEKNIKKGFQILLNPTTITKEPPLL